MPAALSARQDACTALGAGASNSLTYNSSWRLSTPLRRTTRLALCSLSSGDQNGNGGSGDSPELHWRILWLDAQRRRAHTDRQLDEQRRRRKRLVRCDGSIVEFAVTNNGSGNAAAGQTPYCAVSDAGGHATLAVNGDANSFAVCQSGTASVLVYSAVADNGGAYTFDSCNVQTVHLVQA
ncbi:uncharacterized protein B0H18DRAFT_1209910 [Fomitopsis serialis]|uniref:uncharacterized protein n=1 Tax=Fomitopsis serialis TaxID=139415 RepID=UPI0020088A3C|nr:uncharacterized protein B0H18DRAFT_1209910 [Neoantrodia serialis]KAH9929148.1 hypothetical protein B0H18DRAFT_1209910 [Neoantrodia serialis]